MGLIYNITNKINGRVYVGQTVDFNVRYYNHIMCLLGGRHLKSLQDDFDKYGPAAFDYNIIVECDDSEMDKLEQFYIKELKAFEDDGGYNLTTGGKEGFRLAKSSLQKLSNSQLELFKDPNYVDKICKVRKEVAKRPEFREHLKNIAQMTDEKSRKISEAVKASWTNERKEAKSEELSIRYQNPEERKKTSEATKAGMTKMTKEQLSRRHLCETPIETLLEMVKNTHLTQKQLVEQFNVPIALVKKIKSKKHWIYEYIEENSLEIQFTK